MSKESVSANESKKYIASCVLSRNYPEISRKAIDYMEKQGIPVMRCCVNKYKIREFEDAMDESIAEKWKSLPHYLEMNKGDTVVSACHNCTNIIMETRPEIHTISLYEHILHDDHFVYPDYRGEVMMLQDCWRAADHDEEKSAVRELLKRMNITVVEMEEKEDFCGVSLYRPQPVRNPRMAPGHYGPEKTTGKFGSYTEEQQREFMIRHTDKIPTDKVVCYCHYCLEGLQMSGKEAEHLINLLL